MKKYGLLVGIFIILIILGILFFIKKDDEFKIDTSKKLKEALELVEYQQTEDEYYIYIEGKVKNNDIKEYSLVQIVFTTYDKDGNVSGNCIDNVSGLKIDETWRFKATCTEKENIYDYRIKEVAGY